MKINNPNQFVLCCRGKKCPVVDVDGDSILITDDYKNQVKMTKEQFLEIEKVIPLLKKDIS